MLFAHGDFGAVHAEVGKHQQGDEAEDEEAFEAAALDVLGVKFEEETAAGGDDNGDQGKQRDDIEEKQERCKQGIGEQAQTDSGKSPLMMKSPLASKQDQEGPEDDEVVDAEGAGEDFFLAEGEEEHLFYPGGDVVKAVLFFAETDEGEPLPGKSAEDGCGRQKEYGEDRSGSFEPPCCF